MLEFEMVEIKPGANSLDYEVFIKFKIKKMGFIFNPVLKELWVFENNYGWVLNKSSMMNKKPF